MVDPVNPTSVPGPAISSGKLVRTPPFPSQSTMGKEEDENLSSNTKLEQEAGKKAVQDNKDQLKAEQDAGRKLVELYSKRSQVSAPLELPRPPTNHSIHGTSK